MQEEDSIGDPFNSTLFSNSGANKEQECYIFKIWIKSGLLIRT